MEFAFGTNWANYSRFVGGVFAVPLAAEGIFAFFLESSFLGVLLFARKRVSQALLLRFRVAGGLRGAVLRLLDTRGQLLDADPARLHGGGRPGGAHEFLGRALHSLAARPAGAHPRGDLRGRGVLCGRRLRVLPAEKSPYGLRQADDPVGAGRGVRALGGHAPAGPLRRHWG